MKFYLLLLYIAMHALPNSCALLYGWGLISIGVQFWHDTAIITMLASYVFRNSSLSVTWHCDNTIIAIMQGIQVKTKSNHHFMHSKSRTTRKENQHHWNNHSPHNILLLQHPLSIYNHAVLCYYTGCRYTLSDISTAISLAIWCHGQRPKGMKW